MIKSSKNMEMLENTSKHVKLMIIYIYLHKLKMFQYRTNRKSNENDAKEPR